MLQDVYKSGPISITSRAAFRLDLLILLFTTAVCMVAYLSAKNQREQCLHRLNRIEATLGLPFVSDVSKAQIVLVEESADRKASWHVWVPHETKLSLHATTYVPEISLVARNHEKILSPGRNSITVERMAISSLHCRVFVNGELWLKEAPYVWENRTLESRAPLGRSWALVERNITTVETTPVTIFKATGSRSCYGRHGAYMSDSDGYGLKLWLWQNP